MLKKVKQAQDKIVTLARRAGFYVRRLRAEKLTKRVVTSVAAFALVLQLTGGVLPFASTTVSAVGDDNIIRGGITSKADLLAMYDSGSDNGGHNDIKQIYTHFGVSRQDIANSTMGSYKTNDFNGQLKTIGRTNWPNSGRSAVTVAEVTTPIYTGPFLDGANSKAFVMPALIGKRSVDGQWFAVTLNCGNIVYAVTPPPAPKPLTTVCNSLTVTRVSRTEFTFTTKYTIRGETFDSVTYVISDATGKEIARTANANYTQTKAGTYTVKAIVNVTDANGRAKTVSSNACTARFTVLPPATGSSTSPRKCTIPGKENLSETSPNCKEDAKCTVVGKENLLATDPGCVVTPVDVCDDDDSNSSSRNNSANSNTVNCDEPCDDTSGNDSASDNPNCAVPTTPSTATPMCTVVGKENLPANSPNCVATSATPMCTVVGKENLPANSPNCVRDVVTTTPATPQALPQTGLGDDLLKITGLGSLIASVGYYVASRRGLLSAFLNR
jgi:hypothetical protein